MKKTIFAIIPARGGSKRIKRKNIKNFNGKPMIYWTLKKIKKSGLFKKIIVSTEDKEIKTKSLKFGADIVIDRSKRLADDITGTQDVIKHAINFLIKKKFKFDFVFCIYPCNPFLQILDLKKALSIKNNQSKFVFPVVEYSHPIQRSMRFRKNRDLYFLDEKSGNCRTQDLEKTFHDAGQFYLANKKTWLSSKKMHSYSKGIILPSWRVVDIDNEDDWKRAENLSKTLSIS